MTGKRIIPCMDIKSGRVVKGVNFKGLQDIEDPVTLSKYYNESGADELVFYDITASVEERYLLADVLEKVVKEVTIPLTVGGGISTIEDFDRVLKAGADKVSINSGALKNPQLIDEAAAKYGSDRVVLAMDVRCIDGNFTVFSRGGQESTGIDAVKWAAEAEARGAGELVINSIDTDGVKNGFDLPMLKAISDAVSIPIVASGGAGRMEDFYELFNKIPSMDAGLAASVFHTRAVVIGELKSYLNEKGIKVRE